MSNTGKRMKSFPKKVAKGAAKGLGRLARDTASGVIGELTSIMTLGLFRPRRKRRW